MTYLIGQMLLTSILMCSFCQAGAVSKSYSDQLSQVCVTAKNEAVKTVLTHRDSALLQKTRRFALSIKGNVQRHTASFISPSKVNEYYISGKIVIIDVRDTDVFNKYHIPHSINVPIHQLKAKAFLRNKNLVLVHDGYADSLMETITDNLVKSGFTSVKILDGGLNAWREEVGVLVGDRFTQNHLNRISPHDFLPQKKYNHWTVLDISDFGQIELGRRDQIRKYLLELRQENETSNTKRWLITTQSGNDYELIETVVRELGWRNVFYLEGGKQAYEKQVEAYLIMQNRTPGKKGGENRCGGRV